MTYTTLTCNGMEKSLADWGVSEWRREVFNQASDSFAFDLLAATDAAEVFPYGAMIKISTGRTPVSGPTATPAGLPLAGVLSWTGGQTWFVGWREQNVRTGTPRMEGFKYKFAGPWDFFFERLVFQKLWLSWNTVLTGQIADWRSQVVLGQSLALVAAGNTVTSELGPQYLSIALQLKEIAAYVIAQSSYEQTVNGLGWPAGGQFQFDAITTDSSGFYKLSPTPGPNCLIPDFVAGCAGAPGDTTVSTTGMMLRAPLDAVNDLTCAECFRRMLRWVGNVGSPVAWFDYTTTPPTLKVSTRDLLPGVTLPLVGPAEAGTPNTESIKIQQRDDLIPAAIAFKYRISGQAEGTPYNVVVNDVAATVDGTAVEGIGQWNALTNLAGGAISPDAQTELPLQARRFAAQVGTFDFEGESTGAAKATILTTPLNLADPTGGSSSLPFWVALFPSLAKVSNLAFYQDPSGAVAPLVQDPNGNDVNTGIYGNILVEGTAAPWMLTGAGAAGAAVQATITAYFAYTDNASDTGTAVNGGTVQCHPLTIKVKLTNLTSGTYTSAPYLTGLAEPVPYGLPGYIYGIESIPQYQGTFAVVETEISDVCPIGHVLNLSGGLAEWAGMNACIQQVNYDDTGKTELVFGPAQHLGNADLVERLRVNRGPRWLFLIGGDYMNTGSGSGAVALGSNVPVSSPSPGNRVCSDTLLAQSVTDLQSHLSAYTQLLPGVYLWSKGNGRSGLSLVDGGPGIALQGGSGGSVDAQYVLISAAQLLSVVAGQPVKFYELNTCEGGDATTYRTFLCTGPYHHS
jgi:ribosomal protein S16